MCALRFFHLSDLHLGKLVHEFSMLEEQAFILQQVLALARQERPDAVLVAGDVYDRGVAPADALKLLDDFLVGLSGLGIRVFLIAGNHDSAERLAFASRLMAGAGVHIAPAYEGVLTRHTMKDEHGGVDIWMLPFLRPNMVRRHFPDREITTWTEAVSAALGQAQTDPERRHVLLAHQFVTGGQTSESEEFAVGGADNVDIAAFNGFDYVALGHLHRAQHLGRESLRYCGSPLKYSFSEAAHTKSLTVVELGQKGEVGIRALPLYPRRDLVELKGSYEQMMSKPFYDQLNLDNYYRITLTDSTDQPDALQKLRLVYKNLMRLDYERHLAQAREALAPAQAEMTPMMLFSALYLEQNGRELGPEQRDYLARRIEQVWEEEA